MKILNPAAEFMPRSGIRVILDEANKFADVLHLEIGQPDLPTPAHIIEAAGKAARDGYTGYTPNAGYPSLREAFAASLSRERKITIAPQQVVVTVGAMGAVFSSICATTAPGDEVLIPDPGYPNYAMPLRLFGAKAVPYPLQKRESEFSLDVEAIRSLITPKTKLVIVNSPSNPAGLVIPEQDMKALVELTKMHGLYLLSDESYDHIIFEGEHVSPLKYEDSGNIIAVYSCSKTYSMTGWRIGFAVCAPAIAAVITKLQEAFVACAPSISQKAAEAALRGPQGCVDEMLGTYRQRRNHALEWSAKLGLERMVPMGAFYLMLRIPAAVKPDSLDFAMRLVKHCRVAVAPGITFGRKGEGFIRISLCTREAVLQEGLERIAAFVIEAGRIANV